MVSYEEQFKRFRELMSSNPFNLVDREDFSRASELPDVSAEAIEEEASKCLALADNIRDNTNAVFSRMDIDDLLDLELANLRLREYALANTVSTDGSPRYAVLPDALMNLLGLTPIFLTRDPRNKALIVDDFASRMNKLESYLTQALERYDKPVEVWAKNEIDTGKGFSDVSNGIKQFAESIGYDDMLTLEDALKKAKEQIDKYISALETMEKRRGIIIGQEATEKWFKYKGIDLTLDEMHTLAQEFLVDVTRELEELKPGLVKKYKLPEGLTTVQVIQELKKRIPSPKGEVVDYAKILAAEAEKFAYSHKFISPLGDNVVTSIECTPSYLKSLVPIAALFMPGSLGKGKIMSTFYITEFDGIERELNQGNLPTTVSHEFIPGHAYQTSRAVENKSLVRKWIFPQDTAEAWTTYVAEELMTEAGYCGNEALRTEEKFMSLADHLRLGGRVCFALTCLTGNRDYFKNALGVQVTSSDLLEASTELYSGITGFDKETRARRDINYFSMVGPYPALYLVGNKKIKDMVQQAKDRQGTKFEQSAFLEAILKEGSMPLSYIQRALEHKGIM